MKRFVCFLLTLVMIVSLVPATLLTASAASVLTTSDKAIEILKQFEGFESKPYQDAGAGAGDPWYIGYGTSIEKPELYPDGITQTEATALLKEHLEEHVDTEINKLTKRYNLALTQYQHDALAVFTYNVGSAWMSGGVMLDAVINGRRGNDFLNAICEYNGANPQSDYFIGLVNRRLAEANMYLNGIYSSYAPSNFAVIILNTNGGVAQDAFGNNIEVFAYDTATSPVFTIRPTKAGSTFAGWYDEDGMPVLVLDSSMHKHVVTAMWQDGSNHIIVTYEMNSSEAASLIVYHTPGQMTNQKGELRPNTKFTVSREYIDEKNVKWVLGEGTGKDGKALSGWIAVYDMDEIETPADTILATGTTTASVKVYDAATTAGAQLGTLAKNTIVKILGYKNEYTASGTRSWGKIMFEGKYGWIQLTYVDLKQATEEDNMSIYGKTGKIVNAPLVNIRSAAGVNNTKIAELKEGTAVTVFETKQVGTGASAATWGRIKWDGLQEGWVYMFYVQLDGVSIPGDGTSSAPSVALYTGVVTSNTNLNIRQQPSVSSAQLGSLPTGTQINIYEKTTTNGVEWGRTDRGWVCLLYVNLTSTGASTGDSNTGNHILVTNVGTVTSATLSLRKSATNNSEQLGLLEQGDEVTIISRVTEETTTGTKIWGKVIVGDVTGYINLAYVDVKEVTNVIPDVDATPGGVTAPTTASAGVISGCVTVNVRSAAGVRNALVTTLANGTRVTVYEQVVVDNATWGRIDQGWVALQYVTLTGDATTGGTTGSTGGTTEVPGATTPGVISATGIVNSDTDLNVRAGAGLGFAKVGALAKGTRVTIYEQKVADGMIWGKINSGWICMSYVTIDSSNSSGTGVMGTIARCFSHVNVRSAPGTGNALVGTIQVGARVEVFEQRLYSGQYWGRVAQGWVCMQYVLLDSELPPTEDTPATTEPTTGNNGTDTTNQDTVNNNPAIVYSFAGTTTATVDVRQDATSKAVLKGTVNAGTALNFVSLKMNRTASGVLEFWGKTNDFGTPGWINLAEVTESVPGYVQVENLTVYSAATTSSEGIGILRINEPVHVYELALEGSTVWGKLDVNKDNGVVGWIQISKIAYNPTALTSTDSGLANLKGTVNTAMDVYSGVDATVVVNKLAAGATVYIKPLNGQPFFANHGTIWGHVTIDGQSAYVDMSKVSYLFYNITVSLETEVRNVPASNPDSVVMGTLSMFKPVAITSLMCASDGTIWAQIQTNDDLNGGWISIQNIVWF